MQPNNLPNLRKLLGDAWVDVEVFGKNPSHWFGLWHEKDAGNVWVPYTEHLVGAILVSNRITLDFKTLADKLKSRNDVFPTLAEMESAIFLADQGFSVTLEPSFPGKGPDLRAELDSVRYFLEIRTVGLSETEERMDSASNEIIGALNKIPSAYHVMLFVADSYKAGSVELRDAIKVVVNSLEALNKGKVQRGSLSYRKKGEAVLEVSDDGLPKELHAIKDTADFTATFDRLQTECAQTPASVFKRSEHPPKAVRDHERLRKILHEKRKQIPEASRGILVLDVSKLFMLSDFSIDNALYGDLVVQFPLVSNPGEPVGETTTKRSTNGFFRHTSRVSAVVIQKKVPENAQVRVERYVYPTNRGIADTIQLKLAELKRFGSLGDREHLSAENLR